MTTLVLQGKKIIRNPRYGKLSGVAATPPPVVLPPAAPQLTPRIMLDARKLNLAQGATVSSFVGTGSGTILERTFDQVRDGTNWQYPTFDTTDRKSLLFNKTAALGNANTTTVLPLASYVLVANITDPNPVAANKLSRIFTGNIADGFHGLQPSAGRLQMAGGMNNDNDVGLLPTGWFVLVVVYNGAGSKILVSTEADGIRKLTGINTSGQSKMNLGGNLNFTAHGNAALGGNIALFAQYDKALTDSEMQSLMTYYKDQFKL